MQYRPRHPPGRNFRSEGAYHEDPQRHPARAQFPELRRHRVRGGALGHHHQRDADGRARRHAPLGCGVGQGSIRAQRRRHRDDREARGGEPRSGHRRLDDRGTGLPRPCGRDGRGRRLRAEAARREAHEPAEVHHVLGWTSGGSLVR